MAAAGEVGEPSAIIGMLQIETDAPGECIPSRWTNHPLYPPGQMTGQCSLGHGRRQSHKRRNLGRHHDDAGWRIYQQRRADNATRLVSGTIRRRLRGGAGNQG